MKYALVLESDAKTCNDTSSLLASLGYLITPVFSPKKALHAAHMMQFDLIVTCTITIPGDRRCLAGELARCLPAAEVIVVIDPVLGHINGHGHIESVGAVLKRPLRACDVIAVLERRSDFAKPRRSLRPVEERRRRAVE
jgi:hypothetical protein